MPDQFVECTNQQKGDVMLRKLLRSFLWVLQRKSPIDKIISMSAQEIASRAAQIHAERKAYVVSKNPPKLGRPTLELDVFERTLDGVSGQ